MFRKLDGKLTIDKDPDSTLIYGFDLNQWLEGDQVASVTAQTIGVNATDIEHDDGEIFALVSGGTVGEPASITFRFTTESGQIDDRTIHFNILHR